MKVIFLDIDGVLNCNDYYERFKTPQKFWEYVKNNKPKRFSKIERETNRRPFSLWYEIDTVRIKRLNKIVNETHANIVISSSWRIRRDLEELQLFFHEIGLKANVIDKTSENFAPRGIQIQWWLDEHKEVNDFIIIDDDTDMCHLMPYLVNTTWKHGLDDKKMSECISRLNKRKEKKRKVGIN